MVSINANSFVVDENTRERLVWLIKASDYIQSRVLNIRFCTRLMGPPFFFWAIPTYRILPYSMIRIEFDDDRCVFIILVQIVQQSTVVGPAVQIRIIGFYRKYTLAQYLTGD